MKSSPVSWPLLWPLLAAFSGLTMLALWAPSLGPGAGIPISSLPVLVSQARQVSKTLGLRSPDSTVRIEPAYSNSLAQYRQQHPADAAARSASPLGVRVKIKGATVGLDSSGQCLYWQAPSERDSLIPLASNPETTAFQLIAGSQAAAFKGPLHSAGEEHDQQVSEWKTAILAHSEIRESIKVVTAQSAVQSAERKIYVTSDEDNDSSDGETRGYWNVLEGIFATICVIGSIAMLVVCLVWLVRKSVNLQLPLRLAGAVLILTALAAILGARAAGATYVYRSTEATNWFALIFNVILLAGFVTTGRAISKPAHSKWITLEQLCGLARLSKSAGISLAAGVLISPLMAAIPYLIAGSRLIPGSWVLPNNLGLVYSSTPLLDSLDFQSATYLAGFFGFALPSLERFLRHRWLSLLVLVSAGIAFFALETRDITGPIAAPLAAGLLTFALFWIVYLRFDLLAVFALHLSTSVVGGILVLLRSTNMPWTSAAFLLSLFVAAYLIWAKGAEVLRSDPDATFPPLTGFRAEREKLRAEFSVARRAQQDMLPRTPPVVPGYSLSASCTPSLEVGGDLYDFLKLPGGRLAIGVADVSGKGVPAALYMTLTKGLLSSVSRNNAEPEQMMAEVNRHLHTVTRKKVFVTMALGFLDPKQHRMRCVRAGHNPVVWRQTSIGLTSLVSPPGLGLGITAGRVFASQLKVQEMDLSAGDAVVFYSDGITEAMNIHLEQFGEQRLMDVVSKTDSLDAEATRDVILREVSQFLGGVHPQDDMTLVVLRVDSKHGETKQDERITVRG